MVFMSKIPSSPQSSRKIYLYLVYNVTSYPIYWVQVQDITVDVICECPLPYLDPLAAEYPGRAAHEDGCGGADVLEVLDGGAAEVQPHSRLGDTHRQGAVVAAHL